MNDYFTYLPIHDSSKQELTGFNEGKKIAIWSKKGKNLITSDVFAEFVNNIQFDLAECPYDDQNSYIESKKAIRKCYERTKQFVDHLFNEEQKPIKSTNIVMPLVGNHALETRKFFVQHLKESNYKFNGFILNLIPSIF